MNKKPNIVFIFPDQQRGDVVGYAGNPVVKTPNLDRLARESVTFSRCITNGPVCMPARMSIMSGKHVCEHGTWDNNIDGDPSTPNHVRNIRDAGYRTSLIGKVHLHVRKQGDGHSRDHAYKMHAWGWDDSHELRDIMAYVSAECYFTDFLRERGHLDAFRSYMEIIVRGENQRTLLPWETPPSALPIDEDLDMYTAQKAVEWIEDYSDDKPFYLQVNFPGPHNPFDSPAEVRALYDPEQMPPAILEDTSGPISPRVQSSLDGSRLNNMTLSQERLMRAYYYAKVTHIDHGIGMVVDALERQGVLEDTWIIYTSDHGEMLGDHRCRNKGVFYEGALNIPLCIRPPGGSNGWQSRALTDQLDVVETMLDVAGARTLDGAEYRSSLTDKILDGEDASGAQKGKEVVYSEVRLCSMVRNDRFKMSVDSLTREPLDLYDMEEDPSEVRNLVLEPTHKDVRAELLENHLGRLLDKLDQTKVKKYQDTVLADPKRGGWQRLVKPPSTSTS